MPNISPCDILERFQYQMFLKLFSYICNKHFAQNFQIVLPRYNFTQGQILYDQRKQKAIIQ